VITGTLQQNDQPAAQLPQADETHDVPEGFWKVIMYNGKLEAYIMPQWYSGKDWQQAIAPLSEVEQYTGLSLANLLNYHKESD
jgi:endonuclease G